MQTITLSVMNPLGLHARASIKLVDLAARFQGSVQLVVRGRTIDAKDILQVMSVGAAQGSTVELIVEGPEEQQALAAIEDLFKPGIGEI